MSRTRQEAQHETQQERLRRLLEASKGMHAKIAEATGVSQSTVSRIHCGDAIPRLDTAERLLGWFRKNPSAVRGAVGSTGGRRRTAPPAGS